MVVVVIPSPISSQKKKIVPQKTFILGVSFSYLLSTFLILITTSRCYFSLNDKCFSLKCSVSTKPRQYLQPTSILLWVSEYCVLLAPCKRWMFPLYVFHPIVSSKLSIFGLARLNKEFAKILCLVLSWTQKSVRHYMYAMFFVPAPLTSMLVHYGICLVSEVFQ